MELLPSLKLAGALERAADHIKANPIDYDWSSHCQCNCGQVAAQLGALPDNVFAVNWLLNGTTWTDLARESHLFNPEAVCETTGVSIAEILRRLSDVGLDTQAIANLEYLMDYRVIARMPGSPCVVSLDPQDVYVVAAYMRAWAEIIREDHAGLVASLSAAREVA